MAAHSLEITVPIEIRFTRQWIWPYLRPLVFALSPTEWGRRHLRAWLVRLAGGEVRIGNGPWKKLR